MGVSQSSFAIKGKAPEQILKDMGLRRADKGKSSKYTGGLLPNGWYLLCQGRHEYNNSEMQQLSRGCEVVACFVEEHVMVSAAAYWKDGQEIWAVLHDSEEDSMHLQERGQMPGSFASIRDRLIKEQEENGDEVPCDFIFNIPVELSAQITGYRYDKDSTIAFQTFEKPSFFQKLFGKWIVPLGRQSL